MFRNATRLIFMLPRADQNYLRSSREFYRFSLSISQRSISNIVSNSRKLKRSTKIHLVVLPPPAPTTLKSQDVKSPEDTTKQQSEHIVLLTGLPIRTTAQDVRNFLAICNVKILNVQLTPQSDGRRSGNAYVELSDIVGVALALSVSRQKMQEREILVTKSSRASMESSVDNTQKAPFDLFTVSQDKEEVVATDAVFTVREPVLMVQGVRKQHTDLDIRKLFDGFNLSTNSVLLPKDRSGQNVGLALVHFNSIQEAVRAFNVHQAPASRGAFSVFLGTEKQFHKAANIKKNFRKTKKQHRPSEVLAGAVGLPQAFLQPNQNKDPVEEMKSPSKSQDSEALNCIHEPVLMVSGVQQKHTDTDILQLFEGFNLTSDSVVLRKNRLGQNADHAYVRFSCVQDAVRAFKAHQAPGSKKPFSVVASTKKQFRKGLWRNNKVESAKKTPEKTSEEQPPSQQEPAPVVDMPQRPAFVLQEPFLQVSGLHADLDENAVEKLFNGFNVSTDGVAIRRNFQGSLGYAIVEFCSVKDAENALNSLARNFYRRRWSLAACTEAHLMQLIRGNNMDLSVGKQKFGSQ